LGKKTFTTTNDAGDKGHVAQLGHDLAVKLRVVVRVHPALKHLRGGRSIKEPRCDAQCADPVTGGPGSMNLFSLATHVSQRRECAGCR
jgi:hypothetical protein